MSGTRRKPGRLGPCVDGYRARLLSMGYTPGTVKGLVSVLGQVGRWMQSVGLEPAQLNEARIEQFLVARHGEGHSKDLVMRSFRALLDYLRDEHVITIDNEPPRTVLE